MSADSEAHLDVVDRVLGPGHPELRICLDLDVSWRPLARRPAVHIAAADALAPGDRVWMRHAKAGELAGRFRIYQVLGEDGQVTAVPTYRGEGQCFG
jgi:hypothetical protein